MEKFPHIKNETIERNKQFEVLEQLAGFKKLSPKQQQMIRLSLYTQQRSTRGTDAGSAENIKMGFDTEDVFIDYPRVINEHGQPIENQYRISQQHIYDWYCHGAVTGLEKEIVDKKVFYETDVPKLVDKTGYEIKSETDIEDFVEIALQGVLMPAVLHIVVSGVPYHSAVILGVDNSGEYIIWEKKGFSIPYQLTTFKEIFKTYASLKQEWLIRPFNTTELQSND